MQQVQPTNPQNNALVTSGSPADSLIISSDVIIPRVLLMQGTSDFVKERKATMGDIIKSTTMEKLAGPTPEPPLEFIALTQPATGWRIEKREVGKQRWEYAGKEPRTASNDSLPWKFEADKDGNPLRPGVQSSHEWRRVKTLSLFALLPRDIEAYEVEEKKAQEGELPDLSKALTPVLIEFRSTGFPAGKEVVTFFSQVEQFKALAYKYILKLSCFMDSNPEGSFYVYSVDRNNPGKVKAEHLEKVEYWYNIVRRDGAKLMDKVDEETVEGEAPAGAGNF